MFYHCGHALYKVIAPKSLVSVKFYSVNMTFTRLSCIRLLSIVGMTTDLRHYLPCLSLSACCGFICSNPIGNGSEVA